MEAGRVSEVVERIVGARITRRVPIQRLWDGYGELFRVELDTGSTAIVKWVRPPADAHPRKKRSYEVERTFYETRHSEARVARCYGSDEDVLVLEDLDAAGFTGRHHDAQGKDLEHCVRWLATLHAQFMGDAGEGLWPVGTYWHLATRLDELARIADAALRDAAPVVDAKLSAAAHQTLLHGDPKEANFCFGADAVAAVDFQYVGRGCGMKDVAYLLYGRDDDAAWLDVYFAALAMPAVEVEWRALYPIAKLDFCRFLAGWQPAQWKHDRAGQRFVRDALR